MPKKILYLVDDANLTIDEEIATLRAMEGAQVFKIVYSERNKDTIEAIYSYGDIDVWLEVPMTKEIEQQMLLVIKPLVDGNKFLSY